MSEEEVDSQDRAEKARKAQLVRETEVNDLIWLMSDKRGRRVMWRLLERAGIYRSSFTGTAETTFFNEGQRNQGLWLVNELSRHCPSRFSEMQKEASKHERSSNGTSSSPGT